MSLTYLVHYSEINLKGKNRPDFEKRLVQNIRTQHPVRKVKRLRGRIVVEAEEQLELGNVFGIAWWARVEPVASDLDAIEEMVHRVVASAIQQRPVCSFAIRASRADKIFSTTSVEIERWLGRSVIQKFDLKVDLTKPDLIAFVEITRDRTFVFTEKRRGPQGLPVGSSGKLLGLFSGEVDSSVAAYLMAKRGARVELLHFYAVSNAEMAHGDKVGRVAERLLHFLPGLTVHYAPYARFQLATLKVPPRLQRQDLAVFRRFMARVAQELAWKRKADGLFTGDNLGQVASQTLSNLGAMDRVLELPIFRPLIAYEKLEVIELCRRLGFLEIAQEPYKDCCSILARHPSTVAHLEDIQAIEEMIGVDRLVARTLEEVRTISFSARKEPIFMAASPG